MGTYGAGTYGSGTYGAAVEVSYAKTHPRFAPEPVYPSGARAPIKREACTV